MIPQEYVNEVKQYQEDCQAYINDPFWMRGAAAYFKDAARHDAFAPLDELVKESWAYLKYRANAKDPTWGYIDKAARRKYLTLIGEALA